MLSSSYKSSCDFDCSFSSDSKRFIVKIFSNLDPYIDLDFKRVNTPSEAMIRIYKTNEWDGSAEDLMNQYIDLRRSEGRRPFIDAPHFELV